MSMVMDAVVVPTAYKEYKEVEAQLAEIEEEYRKSVKTQSKSGKEQAQRKRLRSLREMRDEAMAVAVVPQYRMWTPALLNQLDMLVSELWDGGSIEYIGLAHPHHTKAMSLYAEKAVSLVKTYFQDLLSTQKDMLSEADRLVATHAPARMLVAFKTRLCETVPMPILTDKVFAAVVRRLGYLEPATREVSDLWMGRRR